MRKIDVRMFLLGKVTLKQLTVSYPLTEDVKASGMLKRAQNAMQSNMAPTEVVWVTLSDLLATKARWVDGRTYVYGILGDPADLDMDFLRSLGPVKTVSLEEIFGY